MGSALLWLATGGVAAAQSPQARLTARAAHVGVVVTNDEVFVSWHRLAGPGKVVVRRGRPDCPQTTADGTAAGEVSRLHVIDRSVKPGTSYCYSVFLRDPSGLATRVAVTGTVNVPDVGNVPPAQAPPALAAPTIAHTRLDPVLVRRVEIGGIAAVTAVLLALVLLAAGRRVVHGRMVLGPTARESIVGRNSGALVVPAMILLGWIGVVIGFVVLR
ncbi:MAG TPA: hypothetical protein VGJ11_01185 [Gaiellales bacterium]